MRNISINKLGTYQSQLYVGDTQLLTFNYGDHGPFNLSSDERESLIFDTFFGSQENFEKNKKMFVDEIKKTEYYQIKGRLSKDELERITDEKNIELTYEYCIKKEGWMDKPKALLQILWGEGGICIQNKFTLVFT